MTTPGVISKLCCSATSFFSMHTLAKVLVRCNVGTILREKEAFSCLILVYCKPMSLFLINYSLSRHGLHNFLKVQPTVLFSELYIKSLLNDVFFTAQKSFPPIFLSSLKSMHFLPYFYYSTKIIEGMGPKLSDSVFLIDRNRKTYFRHKTLST